MPHGWKNAIFSEKGIKNVRLATLPPGPPLPPSLWAPTKCFAGPIVLGIPPRPRGMGRRGAGGGGKFRDNNKTGNGAKRNKD